MKPTDEQTHILDLVRTTDDNLMLNALAGCGKTSTLELIERATKVKPILYLVFNKRNKEEAEGKMLSTTTVRTFNGIGHRIWDAACNGVTLNPKKSNEILRQIISEAPKPAQQELWASYWQVIGGVAMAKAIGYVPDSKFPNAKRLATRTELSHHLEEEPDDLTLDLIDAVLLASIKASYAGSIDYNDQIYMPALFGGTFPKFPLVFVDEYQDLNPVNHAMLNKLVRHRLVGVGDPWQNIYGFRGAKQGGMQEAKAKFSMTSCDLSVSFRCPKAVVESARWRVPHFKWIKPGGHVEHLNRLDVNDLSDNAAIICRNNAPLFKLGMQLLSAGRPVTVAGSDIGPRLVGIMRKLGDEDASRNEVLTAIEAWRVDKLAKESTTANDLADCMRVFAGFGSTLSKAIAVAEHLFAQRGGLQLLTGHKAKGLEYDTVYLLDPWLIREDEQDLNLRYVMQTRSASHLYEVDSRSIVFQ